MLDYVIITPAHNEEALIRFTLNSIVNQTVLPTQWVIVDDNSNDSTSQIVFDYARKFPWITLLKSESAGPRAGGAKVVHAFNVGYKNVENRSHDVVVKLDADLTLPANYFEEVLRAFAADQRIGMCGGYCSELTNEGWRKEISANYHLRGPIKAYRCQCFEQIGGLKPILNWDCIDEMKAMSLGWEVKILPLEVKHHRKTSTLINRGLNASFLTGQVFYKDGYDFVLASCRAINHGRVTKPYALSAVAFFMGFIHGCVTHPPKDVDPALEVFIRKFQYQRIKNTFNRTGL